jgi:ribosome-binding factor A
MKHHATPRTGPSQRQLRVGEQIRHMLVETLRDGSFRDERLIDHGMTVTISEVRCSPDLKNATAYVMTLGGENLDEMLEALNGSAALFQHEINKKANLKFTPRVNFKRDKSFDEAQKIENILRNIAPASDHDDEE